MLHELCFGFHIITMLHLSIFERLSNPYDNVRTYVISKCDAVGLLLLLLLFYFFINIFSVRLLSVLRDHSVFVILATTANE